MQKTMWYKKNTTKEDNLKSLFGHSVAMHQFFLDWRYKLLAGYIFIISGIYYFFFTWAQKPENYTFLFCLIISAAGLIITLIFWGMHHRITKLIWKCQNNAYLIEKDLGFIKNGGYKHIELGLYGNFVDKAIREEIDNKGISDFEEIKSGSRKQMFNPFKHTGAINCLFFLVAVSFLFYFPIVYPDLENIKAKWIEKENKLYELQINNFKIKDNLPIPTSELKSSVNDSIATKK